MAFAVICKSCQARFLLNDDLLRRKVAGKVVTVRCRQCHATIEVDALDVDPRKLAEVERSSTPIAAPPPTPPATPSPEPLKAKGLRPAPPPPRPAAKSTLMGIGAPRPLGATELVALSPGLLGVGSAAQAAELAPEGFPEPPPPPGAVESLDSDDWEVAETPALAEAEPAPESVDDFIEELPASTPLEEELPSSTGTPSLAALTHHEQVSEPRVDDFFANMSAATNGGIMLGAPTIDVSQFAQAGKNAAPDVDMSGFDVPIAGKKTLPQFGVDDYEDDEDARATPRPPIPKSASRTQPLPPTPRPPLATESLSPTAVEPRPPTSQRSSDEPRSRRHVVAPTTKSVPPPAPARQRSSLAAPLLIALAAAAGFLIWKRSAKAPDPVVHAEQATPREPAPAAQPPMVAPLVPQAEPAAVAGSVSAAPSEELTFETAKATAASRDQPSSAREPTATATRPQPEAKPEPGPVTQEEPKAEPTPAREPTAEPSGPFDRSAAAAVLTSSATQASACRKEGDPSGVASVVVTFAPSGRVTSATISGPPFAGTPTGGCIAATLRKARVPAFEGDRVTVSKTVVIQ